MCRPRASAGGTYLLQAAEASLTIGTAKLLQLQGLDNARHPSGNLPADQLAMLFAPRRDIAVAGIVNVIIGIAPAVWIIAVSSIIRRQEIPVAEKIFRSVNLFLPEAHGGYPFKIVGYASFGDRVVYLL